MDTYVFKENAFTKRLNMNTIPYSFPRSAYSTRRLANLLEQTHPLRYLREPPPPPVNTGGGYHDETSL